VFWGALPILGFGICPFLPKKIVMNIFVSLSTSVIAVFSR
jgi:hypothetical protein